MAADRSALLVVFLTVFVDLLGFGIVLPLLPRYAEELHAGDGMLALLMSSFSAMQFVFAPLWGRLSDRVGRRPVLIVGLAGSTLAYLVFGLAAELGPDGRWWGAGALTWILASRIGAGIAGATIPTAQAFIADVTPPEQRGRGMALIGAAFGLGFTFGPLLAVPLAAGDAAALPSGAPGYLAAALSAAALLLAAFRLPESLKLRMHADGSAPEKAWFDWEHFQRAWNRPRIRPLILTIFLTTFAFAQFESNLARLTRRLGLSDRSNYYVFAYVGFTLALAQGLFIRRLLPRVGEARMGTAGIVLMALGLLLVAISARAESAGALLASLPVAVVGFAALTPSLQSLLSRRSLDTEQGGILGVGQSASALARIAGPALGMFLFGYWPPLPFFVSCAMIAACMALVAAVVQRGAQGEA